MGHVLWKEQSRLLVIEAAKGMTEVENACKELRNRMWVKRRIAWTKMELGR